MRTAIQAAGEAMPAANFNRRAMLTGTAVTAASLGISPVTAEPAGESPIMALFRQWEAHYHAAENVPDEVCNAQMTAANAIERQMMALPSSSAADMAAKFIVSTGYGEWIDEGETLLNEAKALVGEA